MLVRTLARRGRALAGLRPYATADAPAPAPRSPDVGDELASLVADGGLLQTGALLGNEWVGATSGDKYEVSAGDNPKGGGAGLGVLITRLHDHPPQL